MDQIAILLVPIFVFVLIKHVLDQRAQVRMERVRLLEEALKNPAIDRQMLDSLTFQLTGARPQRGGSRWLAVVLALGWLVLFAGVGVWVLGQIIGEEQAVAAGILTAIVGFGFVTYPFALRELEARRADR
jgi:hypothetical protein